MTQLKETKIGKSTITKLLLNDHELSPDLVFESWLRSNFFFIEENQALGVNGLRPPQLGGIFAALGYERSDEKNAATIVMPTGTGKTETILSIVVAGKFKKTLVIVPSDALREQTKTKFVELGLLRGLGLIRPDTLNPVVSTIKHGITDKEELDKILNANVLIASAASLSKFSKVLFDKLINECTHLIVDEAHHVTASTWARIKSQFKDKSVFQFTATPFRSDGSRVEGKIIFNYPLKRAQEEGYFKPIIFYPVREFIEEKADETIAKQAISLLREDLENGFDHIVMARASSMKRAKEIFNIYSKEKDLKPVLIDSKTKNKTEVLKAIRNREHKIIVCVNMLGEGFDLPQLKISAIHDPHKSINVMLQFTGRFTRTTKNVGDAKFIANIANTSVNESLEELYKEDSDWNTVISSISSRKIKNEKEYQAFREEFSEPSKLLDLGLTPSISTTIYKMKFAKWRPERFSEFGSKQFQIVDSVINDEQNTLVFSVKSYLPVGWTSSRELFDESWDLYIAFYDKNTDLLFIHSSSKDGLVKRLVQLIAEDAIQVQGEYIFRALANLKRLKLQNVGLNKNKKGLRYSMHTGTEINDQIPDIEANRATKSNIFGKGYENGQLVSVGCSYKGKIWAMDSNSLDQWIAWCKGIGTKILDDTIDTNDVMKTAMQTEELEEFPNIRVLAVEWPIEILRKNEMKIRIKAVKWEESLINCDLIFSDEQNQDVKKLHLSLRTKYGLSKISMMIKDRGNVVFHSEDNLEIKIGEQSYSIDEFFDENPPTLFLTDTSIIDGGFRYYPNDNYAYKYNINNTEDWDWHGIDISVESQTVLKLKHSVQYFTIQKIMNEYDLIFDDDDDAGEVADIVAIKNINDTKLIIDLFHCKYCPKSKRGGTPQPGARIDDVYQVVGQAEKSVKWFADKERLILRLMERERERLKQGKASRIDKGKFEDLINLAKIARYADFQLGIAIVQPAISKEKMSDDQLTVIGATAAYIEEISGVKLRVIINR
ncbi:DEAD/DEAH box helicase family protein [Acinetobacter baumannii]|nr:DEAD/DEAH box helicase family protein [Acinetobacter baumannii]MDO7312940.1 DEAD/DEAH box helicase family protein [Acinetobacter baumannii]MDO7359334.1 DEAD/DEAH box helicase family protein [Acinetobacter baumannii]